MTEKRFMIKTPKHLERIFWGLMLDFALSQGANYFKVKAPFDKQAAEKIKSNKNLISVEKKLPGALVMNAKVTPKGTQITEIQTETLALEGKFNQKTIDLIQEIDMTSREEIFIDKKEILTRYDKDDPFGLNANNEKQVKTMKKFFKTLEVEKYLMVDNNFGKLDALSAQESKIDTQKINSLKNKKQVFEALINYCKQKKFEKMIVITKTENAKALEKKGFKTKIQLVKYAIIVETINAKTNWQEILKIIKDPENYWVLKKGNKVIWSDVDWTLNENICTRNLTKQELGKLNKLIQKQLI